MPVIDTVQIRRGTAAAWISANPVLAAGEEGFETDTGLRKVGDGVTAWNAPLAYNPVTTGTGATVRADSATLTGTPVAPTAAAGTTTTQIATTAFTLAAFTTPYFPVPQANVSALSPNLHYTLDTAQISGSTVTDLGSGGNTGTTHGSPGSVTGWYLQGMSFNGSSQYIDAGNAANLNITSPWTIAVQFQVAVLPTSSNAMWFVGKDQASGRSFAFGIYNTGSGTKQTFSFDSGPQNTSTTSLTVDGLWHSAIVTYDGTTLRFYLDGVADGTVTGLAAAVTVTTTNVNIGRRSYSGAEGYFNGSLDEIWILNNVAITAAQAKALADYGLTPITGVKTLAGITRMQFRNGLLVGTA